MTIKKSVVQGIVSLLFIGVLSVSAQARSLVFQSSSSSAQNDTSSSQYDTGGQTSYPSTQTYSQPAAPVQDYSAPTSQPLITSAAGVSDVGATANTELFIMLEQLQQEVNTLRGLLEEQGHELRTLKQNSRDRYVDLDARVLDLTKRVSEGPKAAAPAAGSIASDTGAINASETPVYRPSEAAPRQVKESAPVLREPTQSENDAYNEAYSLIKDKKFDDAILALFSFTETYPDSALLPNVYYWLGEVYLASSKFEQAKTSFTLVMTAYPDNPKVSDAMYKLAVTLDRLGEKDMAKEYLNEVKRMYPKSSAAKLAAGYKLSP